MATDSFVQVALDGAGKKIRNFLNTIAGVDVYQQVVTLAKSDGTLLDSGVPVSGSVSVSNLTADQLVHATNLDVAVSTLLKPADTLTKVATVDTITNPVGVSILTSPLDVQQNGGNPWGVTQSTTPWVVSGTFYQTTQPVSLTGEGLESLRTQRAMIGRATLRPRADKLRRMGLHA